VQEHSFEASWLSTLWVYASQFWCLAFHSRSSCCCQQGTSNFAQVGLQLLSSLKTCGIWHIICIITMARRSVQLHIYATSCMAKCVHPNTVAKTSFFVNAGHWLCKYEVGALQYTWFSQCKINNAHKWNTFFCIKFLVRRLVINHGRRKDCFQGERKW